MTGRYERRRTFAGSRSLPFLPSRMWFRNERTIALLPRRRRTRRPRRIRSGSSITQARIGRPKTIAPPPGPVHKNAPVLVRTPAPPKTSSGSSKSLNAPLIPGGAYTLQVAALTREADALELATRLQKRKFPAFVVSPQTDKYYRVQVGPYADQKAAEAARKGLEGAGFKAIVKH